VLVAEGRRGCVFELSTQGVVVGDGRGSDSVCGRGHGQGCVSVCVGGAYKM
jgi:hypothetical protein